MSAALLLPLLLAQFPTVESEAFPEALQRKAVAATVAVADAGGNVVGSGALVGRKGPWAYVLTAAHVVAKLDRPQVMVFTPESYPRPDRTYRVALVEALPEGRNSDAAVVKVRVPEADGLPAPLPVCPPGEVPEGTPFAALSVGCDLGMPTPLGETVADRKTVRKAGEAGEGDFWLTEKRQAAGRSGGPLLDPRGHVVGVASLASGGQGYYAHAGEIHRLLGANRLSWLSEK